jgi:2'-5' RNA ligase
MLRLFFALQPTAEQSAELAARVAPLVARLKAQRVPSDNLHATLCFIGAVAEEKLALLESVAGSIRGRPATLTFDALEHWAKPRVLCATAGEDFASGPARRLATELGEAAVAAGFAPDIKPFRAHLTLARKVHPAHAHDDDWPQPLSPALRITCDRFVLMRSDRGESGSIYSAVASWPLDGNSSR